MAVGDAVHTLGDIANDAYLAASSVTEQLVIHNIYCAPTATVEVYTYDGTTYTLVDSSIGGFRNLRSHTTQAVWLAIKNKSGSTMRISYDGMVTK